MASLSIARPGKISERQYLGDLAGLFDRQRKRHSLPLTPESFAADLAASDSLRSGLFTLCNAISHMGEQDLSAEELLELVGRALRGTEGGEGEDRAIPDSMRVAFLKAHDSWNRRDSAITEDEVWPPVDAGRRKPPVREQSLADAIPEPACEQSEAAERREPQISTPGRRTVQEALSLVHNNQPEESAAGDHPTLRSKLVGENGEDLGSMTLTELKRFLEDIEHRMTRLGPHLQQLSTAVYPQHASSADTVIPFPVRRSGAAESSFASLSHKDQAEFNLDPFVRPRASVVPALASRVEEHPTPSHTDSADSRPRGIDALLAAAPVWAKASSEGRAFDEDAFLARHAYLAPSRRPGSAAPASLFSTVTPDILLPPPVAALPQPPAITSLVTMPQPAAVRPAPALIGLDVEDDPLLSPMERLQSAVLRLSPRSVFLALAGLTVFAGGMAGVMAYRTLHQSKLPQFNDLVPPAHLADVAVAQPASNATTETAPVEEHSRSQSETANARLRPSPASAVPAKPRIRVVYPAGSPVSVWPPVPEQIARDTAQPGPASAAGSSKAQGGGTAYIPSSTMIGYALSSPQPAYPREVAHGVSGTVSVEVTVSRLGEVTAAHAVSGPPELRTAAVSAVRSWRFRPYSVNGKPAEVATTLQFYFKGN